MLAAVAEHYEQLAVEGLWDHAFVCAAIWGAARHRPDTMRSRLPVSSLSSAWPARRSEAGCTLQNETVNIKIEADPDAP